MSSKNAGIVKVYEILQHKPYGITWENVELNNLCPLDIENVTQIDKKERHKPPKKGKA